MKSRKAVEERAKSGGVGGRKSQLEESSPTRVKISSE